MTVKTHQDGPMTEASVVPFKGTLKERRAVGKALRQQCPREDHALWKAPPGRPDPVELVLRAEKGRLPDLLPLRHGRMVKSPFAFYRGAALSMAVDLANTPSTGIRIQCCGDAHLANFGGFATPERRIVFGINDLDETLPAPWEWDIKRLAASFPMACRAIGLGDAAARQVVMSCVRSYREWMANYSELNTLDMWYHSLTTDELKESLPVDLQRRMTQRIEREKAKSRAEEIFPKLAEHRGGIPLIKDCLPTIFHNEQFPPGEVQRTVRAAFAAYRETLSHSTRSLLDRYELRDAAIKVVGVGSVGTMCLVLLFTTGENDCLFLQVKEARASVLEPFAGASLFPNHGQRVVNGYRLMQPASDIFLGWTAGTKRHFYMRQLRDVKITIRIETFRLREMDIYARWCGRALALSHARSGLAAVISGYLGKNDVFDRALAAYSLMYADQTESDHAVLERAVRAGSVKAFFEDER